MIKRLLSLFAVCLLASATFAHADAIGTTEMFTLTDGGSCCSPGPFGTIKLVQTATGVVTVTETLAAGEVFSQSSGKEAVEFNVTGAGTISVANFKEAGVIDTTDFSYPGSQLTAPPFGSFLDAVHCNTCVGGQTTNAAGPLSFTVTSTSGVNVSNFTANSGGDFFASDIFSAGNTGDVAANACTIVPGTESCLTTTPTVPEPSSLLLLGTGLAGAAGLIRRRIRSAIRRS